MSIDKCKPSKLIIQYEKRGNFFISRSHKCAFAKIIDDERELYMAVEVLVNSRSN